MLHAVTVQREKAESIFPFGLNYVHRGTKIILKSTPTFQQIQKTKSN